MNTTVNTLEKLCYNEATAPKAFALIYQLAITENDLRDNAYLTFVDLFQVHLAETVLDLNSRLTILEDLQSKGLSKLIIAAYARGLKAFGFIGHVHGSDDNLIDKQYKPQYREIMAYQVEIIRRLKDIAINDKTELSIQAKESLYSRFSEQIHYGQSELILTTIEEITYHEKKLDDHLRNKLIEFTTKKAEVLEEYKARINAILNMFLPNGIVEELRIIVSEAPWIYDKEAGETINLSSKKAAELANKYIKEETNWLPYLNLLLKGEQRQTFYFAEATAKNGFDRGLIINSLIECFRSIPLEEQNSVFVNGLVVGFNDNNFTREIIFSLIAHPETEVHGIRQIRFLKPITIEDLNLVRPLLEKHPDYLRNLEYIDLVKFSNHDIIEVTSWLKDINYSFAIELIDDLLKKEDRWNDLKDVVNQYLHVDNILRLKSFININLHVEDLIKSSIRDDSSTKNIHFFIGQIIKGYDDFNFNNDSLLDRLTYFFLQEYWDVSWNYIGDYLANEESRNYGLTMFLERYKFDNEKLFKWADQKPEKYAAVAFQFMDIYINAENGNLEWEPFARQMIDLYGKQSIVLQRLSSKLSNFMINTYSAESLMIKRKRFIEELKDHPFDEVKQFVQKEIENFEFRIEEEKKFGENYELGR